MNNVYDSAAWTGRRLFNPYESIWSEYVSEALWEISPLLCRVFPIAWINCIGNYIEGCVDCHNEMSSYGHREANCAIREREIEDAKVPLKYDIDCQNNELRRKDEVIDELQHTIRVLRNRIYDLQN